MGMHVWSEAYLCNEAHLLCSIQQHHMWHPSSTSFHSNEIFLDLKTHPDVSCIRSREKRRHKESVNRGISCGWDSVGHHCGVLIRDTAASVRRGNRERLAFVSLSQLQSTNITLVLAFYSRGRVHGIETLLAFHHHCSFGFTICPQFTQRCNKWRQCHILNHETRTCSASSVSHTRNTNTRGILSSLHYAFHLGTLCLLSQWVLNYTDTWSKARYMLVLNKFW